jgi:hypothetical protein
MRSVVEQLRVAGGPVTGEQVMPRVVVSVEDGVYTNPPRPLLAAKIAGEQVAIGPKPVLQVLKPESP